MPITNEEFEAAVKRGLGRAVQWLLSGEVVPDRDFLLHACTHNLAYDLQGAEDRARYMFDIVQATGEPTFYLQFVMQSLDEISDNEDDWWEEDERSVGQMFGLLGLWAKSGDVSVRNSLYLFFEKHSAGSDYSRAEVLVDFDGLDGYLAAVRQWILHSRKQDDHWTEAWLLEHVEERFGLEPVHSFLEQAAEAEPAIGVYLAEVREKQTAWHKRQKQRPKRHWPGYAEIKELIFDTNKRYSPMVWARYGEHLPAGDAAQMAQDLLEETDPKRLSRCLLLFKRRPFPLNPDPLLALAQNADQEVASAARAALAQIEHTSVRALALELMPASLRPWELIEMLIRNFCAGDEQVIERVLSKAWDADEMHWLTLDVRHLAEFNPQPALASALIRLYEEGYCTMCRNGIIELLEKLGPLPPYIVEECRYDAYDATRELAQAIGDN